MSSYKKKVLLHGYFRDNLGDDLFFRVIISRYPDIQFIIPILNYGYKEKFSDLKNAKVIDFWGIDRFFHHKTYMLPKLYSCLMMSNFDAVVCIGGSLFIDRQNPTVNDRIETEKYSFISDWECAYKKHIPYFVLGANWGPVYNDYFTEYFTKAFSTLTDLCFRDSWSYDQFKSMPQARKTGDILLGCPYIQDAVKGIIKKKQVAISVIDIKQKSELNGNSEEYEQKIIEWSMNLMNSGYQIVFMSFCKAEGDEQAIQRIIKQIPKSSKIKVICYQNNWQEILRTMAESEWCIASRFHATVICWTVGTPVFSLAYSQKTKSLLDDCNASESLCMINDIELLNFDELKEKIFLPKDINQSSGYPETFKYLEEVL